MASLPYIQLNIPDYLADTMHLTTEEHGAYLLLIMNYWQRGKPLDNSNGRLASVARLSNDRWISVEVSLKEFFNVDGDIWSHKRLDADLATVAKKLKNASAAGKASAEARRKASKNKGSERPLNDRSHSVEQKSNQEEKEKEKEKEKDKDKESMELLRNSCAAVDYLNEVTDSKYKHVEGNLKYPRARLREGATLEELKRVIECKARDWLNHPENHKYLRPSTLFNSEKFPGYLEAGRRGPANYSQTTAQNVSNLEEFALGR